MADILRQTRRRKDREPYFEAAILKRARRIRNARYKPVDWGAKMREIDKLDQLFSYVQTR